MNRSERQRLKAIVKRLGEAGLARPAVEWANPTIYPLAFRRYWEPAGQEVSKALSRVTGDAHVSVYVHVPFCRRKCRFCVYFSTVGTGRKQCSYCKAVEREIELVSDLLGSVGPAARIYFGGGTPTVLEEPLLDRIFSALGRCFALAQGASFTVETSPQHVDSDRLVRLKEAGVNVMCMGVQSFDERVLRRVGRGHDALMATSAVRAIRSAGFDLFNIDLMVGLPGQDEASMVSTVEAGTALEIPEFSVYYLRTSPAVSLSRDEGFFERETLLFAAAVSAFGRAGYVQVRPHHFVHPDRLGVWRRFRSVATPEEGAGGEAVCSLGFGPSAFGRVGRSFYGNLDGLEPWEARLDAGQLPLASVYELGGDDRMARYLIGNLGQKGALNISEFAQRFGKLPAHLEYALGVFEQCELVSTKGDVREVTATGKLFYDCFERACYPDRWREKLW